MKDVEYRPQDRIFHLIGSCTDVLRKNCIVFGTWTLRGIALEVRNVFLGGRLGLADDNPDARDEWMMMANSKPILRTEEQCDAF